MAKKQSPSWVKKQFVRYELDAAQLKACKASPLPLAELDSLLVRLTEAQYTFKICWDDFNSCQQVIMQTDDEKSANAKLMLVGRGSTPVKALKQVLFKHFQGCNEVWPTPDFTRSESEWDD